jgi:peroxiredoxin
VCEHRELIAPARPLAADFVLPDHSGGDYHLYARLKTGPVVLVFFRGHWCPYCRRYLAKLAAHAERFQQLGASMVAVSPEPVGTSRDLAIQLKVPFPLLSDSDGVVIRQYGVLNRFASGALMPHPAVFVLDRQGAVVFQSIDRNYKKRTTIRTLLTALQQIVPVQIP